MARAALLVYVVWMVVAFGLRTWLQVRQTGDTGFRGVSGRFWSVEWWAGILFVVALLGGVGAPVAELAGLERLVDSTVLGAVGVAVAMAGVVLTLVAQLHMGESWRIGVDENESTELVVAGLFRLVRNPIFTAMSVTAIGLTLMVPNLVSVASLAALVVALELQVRIVEEPYLRAAHGNSYLRYGSQVGRFVPGLGRLAAVEGGGEVGSSGQRR
jgi:protein-S-isoprenylcysteine O-methyltransferase Ste14